MYHTFYTIIWKHTDCFRLQNRLKVKIALRMVSLLCCYLTIFFSKYFLTLNDLTENFRIRKVLENKSNTEEDRVAIVEQQLAQAKLIAEEADKKYEEVFKQSHL